MKFLKLVLVVFLKSVLLANTALASPCEVAEQELITLIQKSGFEGQDLVSTFRSIIKLASSELGPAYCTGVIDNIEDKRRAQSQGVTFLESDLRDHLLLYEKFRLDSYLSSGVSPKRYFGFLDEKGSSAEYEKILREVVADSAPIINQFAEKQGLKVRVVDKEIVVTFLAEGGALLMTEEVASINRVHPVKGIGLDNFREGFAHYPELVSTVDEKFGTRLVDLTLHILGKTILLRPMTFREAVLGTAIMYLYEKELTATLYLSETKRVLSGEPLDYQFVLASLVYNSGILYSSERVQQILKFSTAEYLNDINIRSASKRPRLAVLSPAEMRTRLSEGKKIPRQLTSWNAVYHILQRYGAWVALEKYSEAFNGEGFYKVRN